jgi:hypothetical protein
VAHERSGLVVGRRPGDRLDAVLLCEVVELVTGPARLDQVREQHRVLGRLHRQTRQRLEVVCDQLRAVQPAFEARVPLTYDDAVVLREREAAVADRKRGPAVHLREFPFAPFDLRAFHAHRLRGHGLVEDVHPAEQVAELEPSEHLAQL